MNDRIKVEGLGRLDGEYEIDAGAFTNRDLHTIKTISGVRAGELDEAWSNIDNDLMVAFTAIGLRKAGVTVDKELVEALWDAPLGAITFLAADEEESDQLPLEPQPSVPDVPANASGSTTSSGNGSSVDGGHPPNSRRATGSPGSDTGATSDPVTSTT